MYRKVLLSGATAAVIIGAGTAALATTGSDTTAGTLAAAVASTTASPSSTAPAHPKAVAAAKKAKQAKAAKGKGKLLRRAVTAQVVTKGKNGYVTHDLIKGTVSAVSPTSITVLASNKKTETEDRDVQGHQCDEGAGPGQGQGHRLDDRQGRQG
jgi:hypothetical protein